jgi:hypothetical protein
MSPQFSNFAEIGIVSQDSDQWPRRQPAGSETFAQPHKIINYVIPAKAGIQYYQVLPGFRFSPE